MDWTQDWDEHWWKVSLSYQGVTSGICNVWTLLKVDGPEWCLHDWVSILASCLVSVRLSADSSGALITHCVCDGTDGVSSGTQSSTWIWNSPLPAQVHLFTNAWNKRNLNTQNYWNSTIVFSSQAPAARAVLARAWISVVFQNSHIVASSAIPRRVKNCSSIALICGQKKPTSRNNRIRWPVLEIVSQVLPAGSTFSCLLWSSMLSSGSLESVAWSPVAEVRRVRPRARTSMHKYWRDATAILQLVLLRLHAFYGNCVERVYVQMNWEHSY